MSKREFSEADKQYVIDKYGMVCFVANHPIMDGELEYDHIHAYAAGGDSNRDNIAPVCKKHNRDKRDMSLLEYRDKLTMDNFFDNPSPRILNDILVERGITFGQRVYPEISTDGTVITLIDDNGTRRNYPLYRDSVTGYQYFYSKLPITYIQNDKELQPRPLESKRLWQLYRHLSKHTQLSPSIGRLVNNQVLVFDGQHKIAAQTWAGHTEVDCKIYINPDTHDLMQTNLDAHYSLKQMSFYNSIMVGKLAQLSQIEWEQFLDQPGAKSEASFANFLVSTLHLSKADATKRLSSTHIEAILRSEDPENRLSNFISESNRNPNAALTPNIVEKVILKLFLTAPPVSDEFESSTDFRTTEIKNIVRFMNLLAEITLENVWNPQANNAEHQKAERIYLSGSIRAWNEVLRDAIAAGVLQLFSDDDKSRIFYREVSDTQFESIRSMMQRLFSHTIWVQPWSTAMEGLRVANNDSPRQVFRANGLTASWLLGMST